MFTLAKPIFAKEKSEGNFALNLFCYGVAASIASTTLKIALT